MTDDNIMSKTELLTKIQQGWDNFNTYIKTLTTEQLTGPTDAAGWTVKDHLIHIAIWEDGINALLDSQPRREHMGIDEDTWHSDDFDRINAVIQQRYQKMPLEKVMETLREVHQRLVEKVESLSDDDLQRPYRHFQPDTTEDRPVIGWIISNTYQHYAEHIPWIAAIVAALR